MKFLPYGRQNIDEEDIAAVVRTLKSDFLTQGPAVEAFEEAFRAVVGAPHAIACSNGTAALHLAALAAGITCGDVVIVPPLTFVASANCARFVGAEVVFADIDPQTLTMSPQACERQLQRLQDQGRRVRAVVTVDMAGQPCDMQAFVRLKQKFDFIWIEDACHAIGATWRDASGRVFRVGEHPFVDYTVYSFHPVKHITCGEGGMITTHCDESARALRLFRSHGITRDSQRLVSPELAFAEDGTLNPWYYEMQELGFNYRMTDIQGALVESQLRRLPDFLARRRHIAQFYRERLSGLKNLSFPLIAAGVEHAWHLVIVLLEFDRIGKSRAQFMNELRALGIGTQVHYIPVPLQPFYADCADMADLPAVLHYYQRALSIPCYAGLTDSDLERVAIALEKVIGP